MKPFWVYILHCADGSYYTGHTDDLDHRLAQHHHGEQPACYTFCRRPLTLVFSQAHATRDEAIGAERQIKGWSRRKKEALIRGDWSGLVQLARSYGHGSGRAYREDENAPASAASTQSSRWP